MSDEATTSVSADAPLIASTTNETMEAASMPHANGDAASAPKADDGVPASADTATELGAEGNTGMDGETPALSADADSTPGSGGKDKKRKSTGGIPEHKSKKLNKKKSMPTLHLECKPGDYYWARLKGYPPWPSIVCDEGMLPESLLASRPVSTSRPDGSIRDDFKEGGKNAKERTFPIMFLFTNEFQWMVNTALSPLDIEECKTLPTGKMTKALKGAYDLAAENHDIHYFKGLLKVWQAEEESLAKEIAEWEAEKEARLAEKNAKEESGEKKPQKKAARKSKAADDDVEMEDAEAPKSSKKRKKDAESDAEGPKQKKTPKITKLNAPKTPNGETPVPAKKSTSKPKRKVVAAPKEEDEESKPQMTEAEKLVQREKTVLYLRHRLQKGFLSRDQAPQESEMAGMADFFSQLEAYDVLETAIIRTTKIHKVLKAIVKLASVPRDEEFQFKKRSAALLEAWNKRMEAEGEVEPKSAAPETNGEHAAEPDLKPADADQALEQKDAEMKDTNETKEGEEKAIIDKAEEAAEQLEEKAQGEKAANLVAPTEALTEVENPVTDSKDEANGDVSMESAS